MLLLLCICLYHWPKECTQMTLISFAFSPRVTEGHSHLCSHSQCFPTGHLRSTLLSLPRQHQRPEYQMQPNVKSTTAASVWWLHPFCACVPSLPVYNNNRRSPDNVSSPKCASAACTAAMIMWGTQNVWWRRCCCHFCAFHTLRLKPHALLMFPSFIWTDHSLQQLSGNPLVRAAMHVGVWEDCPDCWCWNLNAVLRKRCRMAVSCCRC